MRAIFISYRREDAEGQAGRLFDDLTKHFGENAVFMDVTGIAAGRDFRRVIEEHVASCGVLLAMIGKDWIDAKDESGRRRLEDPADFVRLETASALKRDIPVVPVLVQGARMPRREQLPEDIAELAYRNGVELTHARWDSDVQVLIKALSPYMESETKKPQPTGPGPTRIWPMAVAGLVVAAVMAIGGYAWYQTSSQRAEEQRLAEEKRTQDDIAERQRLADERRKQAEADRRAREAAAAAKAAADKAAARDAIARAADEQRQRDQAAADKAAADKAAADKAAAAREEADRRASEKAAADKAAAQRLAAEKATAQAEADRRAREAAAAARDRASRAGMCLPGYVWREAGPNDRVCVTPSSRAQAAADNQQATARREPGGGPYGPNTCRQGYVWREAYAGDVVCVTPDIRTFTAGDNARASSRVVR